MRRLVWLATALVLAAVILIVPRFAPALGEDPFPAGVQLKERAAISGGWVTVDKVTAAPTWTDGDTTLSLKKERALFVEVRATARPDRKATGLQALIRYDDRTYELSDRAGSGTDNPRGEPGFDQPVVITFEVPAEAVEDGEVRLRFTDGSEASLELDDDSVTRLKVLEEDE